uniref:Uncharacterized protein n=1 Tax=Arundo donax TaxID=35708 RepID=A0A0A9ADP8_ARUDO
MFGLLATLDTLEIRQPQFC